MMSVSRLRHIPGSAWTTSGTPRTRPRIPLPELENLDTDCAARSRSRVTHAAIESDDANSYLPFQGHRALREAAAAHVGRIAGAGYDPEAECVSVAGGLNGIFNVLLATVSPVRRS